MVKPEGRTYPSMRPGFDTQPSHFLWHCIQDARDSHVVSMALFVKCATFYGKFQTFYGFNEIRFNCFSESSPLTWHLTLSIVECEKIIFRSTSCITHVMHHVTVMFLRIQAIPSYIDGIYTFSRPILTGLTHLRTLGVDGMGCENVLEKQLRIERLRG